MPNTRQQIADALVAKFRTGTLIEAELNQGIADIVAETHKKRQDILYLQTGNTSPAAQVIGMTYIESGILREESTDANKWPYQTVLDALQEGWRIISFPNMALLTVPEEEFHGLGFEFILERWR